MGECVCTESYHPCYTCMMTGHQPTAPQVEAEGVMGNRAAEFEISRLQQASAAKDATIKALEGQIESRKRMMLNLEEARPLCPDCRDKQRGKNCLGCTQQTLLAERDALKARVEKLETLVTMELQAGISGISDNPDYCKCAICNEARAILANRPKEESKS